MNLLLDSFWRAAAYCLRPGVILLSLLPLALSALITMALGYFFWESAIDQVLRLLESSAFGNHGWAWLEKAGFGQVKVFLAPLIVIFTATPVIVMASILVVALVMAPSLVRLVARRRFLGLEKRGGASFMRSLAWSLSATVMALGATIVSMPLWFVPPLVLVLPPLIWGWLTYRVMAFDALADHASPDERRALFKQYRWSLLGMGLLAGYLGAAPSLLWASGAMFAAPFAFYLLPLVVWIYTLVFAFSALWFAHYGLSILHRLRLEQSVVAAPVLALPQQRAVMTLE